MPEDRFAGLKTSNWDLEFSMQAGMYDHSLPNSPFPLLTLTQVDANHILDLAWRWSDNTQHQGYRRSWLWGYSGLRLHYETEVQQVVYTSILGFLVYLVWVRAEIFLQVMQVYLCTLIRLMLLQINPTTTHLRGFTDWCSNDWLNTKARPCIDPNNSVLSWKPRDFSSSSMFSVLAEASPAKFNPIIST